MSELKQAAKAIREARIKAKEIKKVGRKEKPDERKAWFYVNAPEGELIKAALEEFAMENLTRKELIDIGIKIYQKRFQEEVR